jgi:hypothetical protein
MRGSGQRTSAPAGVDAGSFSNPLTLDDHNSSTASPASFAGSSLMLEPTSVNIQIGRSAFRVGKLAKARQFHEKGKHDNEKIKITNPNVH